MTKNLPVYTILSLFVVFMLMWLLKSIMLPFVVGIITAYFLDPLVDKFTAKGLGRTTSTAIVSVVFFSVIIISGAFIIPPLMEQAGRLIAAIPDYASHALEHFKPYTEKLKGLVDAQNDSASGVDMVGNFAGDAGKYISNLLGNLIQSSFALVNLLSMIFITPVVSFYLLRDWDDMTAKIHTLLPAKHSATIIKILGEIDEIISGYIRGQTLVCLMLCAFYAIGLLLCGLHYGLIIGLMTGLLAFIPYVGLLAGMSVGVLSAVFQFEESWRIGAVVAIFIIGQFIEGNFITPKIVGERVKLHPVWIIFGLLAGGTLFGFTGVLVAVPVSAVIGVLVRFAIERRF